MEVDFCFVMDCTGSMSCHIKAAKDCIIKVADHMSKMEPAIKIRVGFCGYRDHCDGYNRLQIFNFTNSYEEFRNCITNVSAIGGGDAPEDVLGGLNAAVTQMTWRNANRILLHIGDYPPHGVRFTNGTMADSYPAGDPNGLTAESVIDKMLSANICYSFGKVTNHTETMINVFRNIIGEFSVFNLETLGENPEALVNKFFNAICSAISTAISLNE